MKKILLTCIAAMGLVANANAQLAEGSVFPYPGGTTGALTAVNSPFTGQRFNLDSISNAGYTIFIDISATWCNPCWNYHTSKQLDTLWAQHGPTGMPGVNASTTNDVYVFFVQGEPTSLLGELYDCCGATAGSASVETPYATASQGNWVTGTPFPMIDDTTSTDANYGTNAIDAAWNITFFPTVYMVCRDHLVHNLTQPTYAAAYAAAQATCPTYAPASGSSVNAKAVTYQGNGYFVCNANPSLTFQNYSSTANITAANITVKDATGTTVATVPWTGTLAPFGTATVTAPSFAGTSFGGYNYSVNVAGDVYAADDNSADSIFKVYNVANSGSLPFSDNLSGGYSYKYTLPADSSIFVPDNLSWPGCPDPTGATATHYFIFDFYDFQAGTGTFDMVVGNFNTDGITSLAFQFEESYAPYTGATDVMNVLVSDNCGSTWNNVWTANSTALATAAATTSSWQPTAAGDWALRTVVIPLSDTSNNMMIKFTGTSGYGNLAWVTDLSLVANTALGTPKVLLNNEVTIAPNPAKDLANISLTLTEGANVQIQVIDAVGRVVNTLNEKLSAGAQNIELSTTDLSTGIYNVKISTGNTVVIKKLSVIK